MDNLKTNTNNIFKIAGIICFLFITIALLITSNSPAVGYETSIYDSTPIIMWLAIGISSMLGFIIIIHQIWTEEYEKNNKILLIGFVLIILSNVIVLSLSIIRGYYLWAMGGDPATHLGYIYTSLKNGVVPEYIFYPVLHTYTAVLSEIGGLSVVELSKLIPLYFSLIFITFMYFVSKTVLPKKGEIILATLASLTFIYACFLNFTPNHMANLLFPMALFIILKSYTKKVQWSILLVLIAVLYPLFHVVPTIALIIIICTLTIPYIFYRFKNENINKFRERFTDYFGTIKITSTLLMAVIAVTWISSFYVWDKTVKNINTLLTEGATTHLNKLTNQALNAQLHGFDVVSYALKEFGGIAIFLAFSLISLPIIWRKLKNHDQYERYITLFSFFGPLFMILGFTALLYVGNISFGPNRMFFYIIVICTFFVGFFLFNLLQKAKKTRKYHINKIVPILVLLIIFGVYTNSILTLYPSPYILDSNPQTTKMEYDGMTWYFDKCPWATNVSTITVVRLRFADLKDPDIRRTKTQFRYASEFVPPFHFDYNQSSVENKKTYLLLTKRDVDLYNNVFPSLASERWYVNDFSTLENNTYFGSIYSNGEFTIRFLKTTPK